MLPLESPVKNLHHIGSKTAPRLSKLGIETIADLLWYVPMRYEDMRNVVHIADVPADTIVTVRGKIIAVKAFRSFKKRMFITDLRMEDDTGELKAVWFGQSYISKTLKVGDEIYLSGKAKISLVGPEFTNPVYEKVREEQLHTAHIIPYYSLTEGISHKQLRFLIQTALKSAELPSEEIPSTTIQKEKLSLLADALKQVHFPDDPEKLEKAIRRLKFEELFWLQLGVGYAKRFYQQHDAPQIPFKQEDISDWVKTLPFTLTDDQRKAGYQIVQDLEKSEPMNRLIQGDVGSGKTVVAAMGILSTALAGYQSALMAPTEVLALQHYETLRKLLPNLPIALLSSKYAVYKNKKTTRKKILEGLSDETILLAIGTHSLIQKDLHVPNLGLVIVDEQHRFGVGQRKTLTSMRRDSIVPHLLSLTATPIPRTLALTLYGELAVSNIKERPQGRKPIITKIVDETNRPKAYTFIQGLIKKGQQVFILCPLINENDRSESKSVLAEYERLQKDIFPELELRYLHGKLKTDQKKKILEDFKNGAFPILVTTSVIEVGIDIPQATVMIIEGADRFGIAQLHQFRGRVGRNDLQSYCLLFTDSKNETTKQRLELLTKSNDGFELAEADLKLRGEGEVFGSRQSGIVNFKIATLRDTDLIEKAKKYVDQLVQDDTNLEYYNSITHKLDERVGLHWE